MEASSAGGSKYIFLPAGHKLLALNRSLFKCSYQVATREVGNKMGLVLGGDRGWKHCWDREEEMQGATALWNALHVRHC